MANACSLSIFLIKLSTKFPNDIDNIAMASKTPRIDGSLISLMYTNVGISINPTQIPIKPPPTTTINRVEPIKNITALHTNGIITKNIAVRRPYRSASKPENIQPDARPNWISVTENDVFSMENGLILTSNFTSPIQIRSIEINIVAKIGILEYRYRKARNNLPGRLQTMQRSKDIWRALKLFLKLKRIYLRQISTRWRNFILFWISSLLDGFIIGRLNCFNFAKCFLHSFYLWQTKFRIFCQQTTCNPSK